MVTVWAKVYTRPCGVGIINGDRRSNNSMHGMSRRSLFFLFSFSLLSQRGPVLSTSLSLGPLRVASADSVPSSLVLRD